MDNTPSTGTIEWSDFEKVELRAGTILEASVLEKAHTPAYKLKISLGDLGVKQSSARITKHYTPEELVGRQVLCVTNFPPKRIAGWLSEVLVTGFPDEAGDVVLVGPDVEVPEGGRLY